MNESLLTGKGQLLLLSSKHCVLVYKQNLDFFAPCESQLPFSVPVVRVGLISAHSKVQGRQCSKDGQLEHWLWLAGRLLSSILRDLCQPPARIMGKNDHAVGDAY